MAQKKLTSRAPGPDLLREWRTSQPPAKGHRADVNHLSQQQAAKLTKLHVNTYVRMEAGRSTPTILAALRVERATKGKVPLTAWVNPKEI